MKAMTLPGRSSKDGLARKRLWTSCRMIAQAVSLPQNADASKSILARGPFLQRKCAGGKPAVKLAGCFGLHAASMPEVRAVLRSPGLPLDAASRVLFEPRFSHDFGKVRVHADASAAASARSLNALAYTVGHDIVFDAGQYAPRTSEGARLLAHELTHVVQQRGLAPASDGLRIDPDRAAENEAETVAVDFARSPDAQPLKVAHASAVPALARQPKAQEFPGFSQGDYVTCGAASVVTALLIWDRERKDPNAPNTLLTTACNTVLVYLDDRKSALVKGWNSVSIKGTTGHGQEIYDETFDSVTAIRDAAMVPKARITQSQYEALGLDLYVLFKNSSSPGLGRLSREQLLGTLGISPTQSESGNSFDELMDKLSGLMPGQTAQVSWYSRGKTQADGRASFAPHAFLVGRFQRGPWFLSDQGQKPPVEIEAPDLPTLKSAVRSNTQANDGGIHTGQRPAVTSVDGVAIVSVLSDAGVMVLSDRKGIETKARDVVMKPGDFIAEVDASVLHYGDRITAWDFVARATTHAEARVEMDKAGTGSGGVILENPVGLFHAFKTSLVSDINVMETKIDEGDSSGGKLAKPKQFHHAWLQLRSGSKTGLFFQVY